MATDIKFDSEPGTPERTAEIAEKMQPVQDADDDNPFAQLALELIEDGHSWRDVHDLLDGAYEPVGQGALKEDLHQIPEFELKMVMYDPQSTSGERYETFTEAFETTDEAREWALHRKGAERVENIEQVGTVGVHK